MESSTIFSILTICSTWSFVAYMFLKIKYPARGLKVIENVFKKTISFQEALEALKNGNRIRRKSERKGYTKLIIIEGKKQKEKFGSYWVGDGDTVTDYCSFALEDVFASDWIIDE